MDLNLRGKNALVCGSSKGIGKAAAVELAALGANVTLVARSAAMMSTLVRELDHRLGQRHDFLAADFSDTLELKKKVRGLTSGKAIHILVNNTGGPPAGPILEASTDAFLDAYTKHLVASHLLAQAVVPGMKREGYGRIINVISTSVKTPLQNLGVSNSTRGAVANWAKTLANELGRFGITVNNVLPGATNTERLQNLIRQKSDVSGQDKLRVMEAMQQKIPLGRFAEPEEIGAAIAFLAAPAAAYISGINLPVDGGRTPSL